VDILDLEEAKREAEAYGDIKLYKRVRALLLVGRDGKSRNEAAEIVECDRRSIFGWQQRFDERGGRWPAKKVRFWSKEASH